MLAAEPRRGRADCAPTTVPIPIGSMSHHAARRTSTCSTSCSAAFGFAVEYQGEVQATTMSSSCARAARGAPLCRVLSRQVCLLRALRLGAPTARTSVGQLRPRLFRSIATSPRRSRRCPDLLVHPFSSGRGLSTAEPSAARGPEAGAPAKRTASSGSTAGAPTRWRPSAPWSTLKKCEFMDGASARARAPRRRLRHRRRPCSSRLGCVPGRRAAGAIDDRASGPLADISKRSGRCEKGMRTRQRFAPRRSGSSSVSGRTSHWRRRSDRFSRWVRRLSGPKEEDHSTTEGTQSTTEDEAQARVVL
jgi:hypothetical protein